MEIMKRAERAARGECRPTDSRGARAADRLLQLSRRYDVACPGLELERDGGDGHCAEFPAQGWSPLGSAPEACGGDFEAIEGKYVDDVTGLPLDAAMVQAGRLEELCGFE